MPEGSYLLDRKPYLELISPQAAKLRPSMHSTPISIRTLFLGLPQFSSKQDIHHWIKGLEGNRCGNYHTLEPSMEEQIGETILVNHPLFDHLPEKHQLAAFCSSKGHAFSIYLQINYEGQDSAQQLEKDLAHVTNHLVSRLSSSHLFRPLEVEDTAGHVQFFRQEPAASALESPYEAESLDISWEVTENKGFVLFKLYRACHIPK